MLCYVDMWSATIAFVLRARAHVNMLFDYSCAQSAARTGLKAERMLRL